MNSLLLEITNKTVHLLPATRCFRLKRALYRFCGVRIGQNVRICSSVVISGDGELSIGDNTWIGHQVLIVCANRVEIGKDCDIAPRVYIGDGTHVIDKESSNIAGKGTTLPIRIGNGCWLCANATILSGACIGDKCIIASGSVFKGNSNPFELWGGVLAKKIKDI